MQSAFAARYASDVFFIAKKRFTRENKDNDKHKRGTHKCPYIEELHDMKTLYK